MRLSGKLSSWSDDRGHGFIAPGQGGAELFVHISALPRDGSRPTVGETLTYELGRGRDGRPRAVNVLRTALAAPPRRHVRPASPATGAASSFLPKLVLILLVAALGAYGYREYEKRVPLQWPAPTAPGQSAPLPVVRSSAASPAAFRCDGRTHCTQMTSCAEAQFFVRNCPGTRMDGNHDGVPCEQQWCTGPGVR